MDLENVSQSRSREDAGRYAIFSHFEPILGYDEVDMDEEYAKVAGIQTELTGIFSDGDTFSRSMYH